MEPNTADTLESTVNTTLLDTLVDSPETTEVLVEEISIDGMCGVY